MAILGYVSSILIAQLFYAVSVTMLVTSLSGVTDISSIDSITDNVPLQVEDVGEQVESSFSQQIGLPLVDVGSLVFFSGNIIADLVLNFVTAVPGMINILFSVFFIFFPVESSLQLQVKLFVLVLGTILYLISTMAFLANLRAPGSTAAGGF